MLKFIKKFLIKHSDIIATLSIAMTVAAVNSTCRFYTHEEELPEGAKGLRKF
jgi:cyclic lactone autoinducer peptide